VPSESTLYAPASEKTGGGGGLKQGAREGTGSWWSLTWLSTWLGSMFADESLPKCNKNIADTMVQMISLRTKMAVWSFLLIGTWFIFEIEKKEIQRFRSEHGWKSAFKEYLHTESLLQMLQNLSSFLLFPCAVSMFGLHAMQPFFFTPEVLGWLTHREYFMSIFSNFHHPISASEVLGWLTYWEYFMSICLTGCFM
jgi:hypothetical protein